MACVGCTTLTSILKGCETSNSGGIYEVYIADQCDVTYSATSAHTMTSISANPKFVTFSFNRNVGSLTSSEKIDLVNGSTFFENTITLALNRQTAAKHTAITVLGSGQRFLAVIVKDANNDYWFVEYAQLTGNEAATGVNKADGSKYSLTLVAQADTLPIFLTPAQALSVIAP